MAGRSKTTAVTFPHFKAELLVAKQGPLLIQLRKQQTGLVQARGLQEPVIRTRRGHLLWIPIPELPNWQNPAKPATKAIEQLQWMH